MDVNKTNGYLLVLVLYITPLSLLLVFMVPTVYLRIGLLGILIVITLFVNRLKFNYKFLILYSVLIIVLMINVLLVDYKAFVIIDSIRTLFIVFVPLYLFSQKLFNFNDIVGIWYRFSTIMTCLLPLYYVYYQLGLINYMDLGLLTHINSIILIYLLLKSNKKSKIRKATIISMLLINVIIGLVFGSRMILGATLIISLYSLYMITKKNLKNVLSLTVLTSIIIIVWQKKLEIVYYIISFLNERGIHSRNITLIYNYFMDESEEGIYLSGRETIYATVQEHLEDHGLFPSGLSLTRYLTNGEYYHSHSFYLEFPLVFGYIISIILFIYMIIKLVALYKKNKTTFNLITLLLISFLARSITGTYFVFDSMFIIVFVYLITFSVKKNKWREVYGE